MIITTTTSIAIIEIIIIKIIINLQARFLLNSVGQVRIIVCHL